MSLTHRRISLLKNCCCPTCSHLFRFDIANRLVQMFGVIPMHKQSQPLQCLIQTIKTAGIIHPGTAGTGRSGVHPTSVLWQPEDDTLPETTWLPDKPERVQRLMSKLALADIMVNLKNSEQHPERNVFAYLLHGVNVSRPNQVWSADILYCRLPREDSCIW